jgi:hypothetical protein
VNFQGAGGLANVTVVDTTSLQMQGGLSLSGDLDVTAAGITQASGGLDVDGTSSFDAGSNAIALTDGSNDFTGSVTLTNSGANNVAITDANSLDLAASSVGSGTLTVTAVGITQSGAITQAAGAGAVSIDGVAAAIDLSNAGNDFTGAVSMTNSGANDATLVDANSLQMADSTIGGNFLVTAGGDLVIALLSAGETVDLTSNGGNIVNNNGTATNIEAIEAFLTATGVVGTSSSPITLSVPRVSGTTTITVTAAGGQIINLLGAEVETNVAGLDATASGVATAVGASVLSALEEIGFVDWAGLDPEVRLVDCLEPCIKLPADQVEDEGLAGLRDPNQMLVIRTASGIKLVPVYVEPIASLN